MGHRAERRLIRVGAAYALLLGLLALGAIPAWAIVDAAQRPTVVRLAGAALVGVVCLHLLRARARAGDPEMPWRDGGPGAAEPRVALPQPFVDLRGDLRAALRSQRSFDRTLWPRCARLAPGDLARPQGRAFGLGPSLAALRALVAAVERRP